RPDEEVACDPYEVETGELSATKIEALLASGVWGDEEKLAYGIDLAEPFAVPEGKVRVGEPSYAEVDGVVTETYEVEDAPPPPPPPTPEQKLALAGLTAEEFDAMVSASIARQQS